MRVNDLNRESLLHMDPDAGVIRFAGQRALLLDAVAMGFLRKYLVENFGLAAARTVLTQLGFAHGWRVAEALHGELGLELEGEEDWHRAGLRVHAFCGFFRVEPGSGGPLSTRGTTLAASYEAEQHLLHLGRSPTPVCWTICGLMSGYVSRSTGREVFVLEDRCTGQGDAACHHVGRTRETWGGDRGEELQFFEPSRLATTLDVSLRRVTATLKAAERKLDRHRRALSRVARDVEDPLGIVARSAAMRRLVDLTHRVARVDSTVLLSGESGSGKERFARLVHDESARAAGPFIAVNCGAVTETLLESELFGHARGAFTGASHDRPGLFEAANGGTLLLDEIGEISPGMQVKLLRALQEREIRRVGENQSRRIDVRVVAATNRNLALEVRAGTFRRDLFYRLNVIELHVPALRERREDILPLARVLLAQATLRMKSPVTGLSPAVGDQLLRYAWPGNVRELENAMERAAALARGSRVELEDLPEELGRSIPRPSSTGMVARSLAEVEREHILATLARNGGNRTQTARELAIGSATLYRKLKRYGDEALGRATADDADDPD